MSSIWNVTNGSAEWSSGGLHGSIAPVVADGSNATLSVQYQLGDGIRLTFGPITYSTVDGAQHSTYANPVSMNVQDPYLITSHSIQSEVGLRLVAQAVADADGMMIDVCLETIAPLQSVVLPVDLTLSGCFLQFPEEQGGTGEARHRRAAHWSDIMIDDDVCGALLLDLGETGSASPTETGWRLVMFNQPLEKGVILVGRCGVLRRPPAVSIGEFLGERQEWISRPTFL